MQWPGSTWSRIYTCLKCCRVCETLKSASLPYSPQTSTASVSMNRHQGRQLLHWTTNTILSGLWRCKSWTFHDAGTLRSPGLTGFGSPIAKQHEASVPSCNDRQWRFATTGTSTRVTTGAVKARVLTKHQWVVLWPKLRVRSWSKSLRHPLTCPCWVTDSPPRPSPWGWTCRSFPRRNEEDRKSAQTPPPQTLMKSRENRGRRKPKSRTILIHMSTDTRTMTATMSMTKRRSLSSSLDSAWKPAGEIASWSRAGRRRTGCTDSSHLWYERTHPTHQAANTMSPTHRALAARDPAVGRGQPFEENFDRRDSLVNSVAKKVRVKWSVNKNEKDLRLLYEL